MTDLAIIVPTVNRAYLIADLLDSINRATRLSHRVVFVAERTDTDTAIVLEELLCGYRALFGNWGSYTAAANAGVEHTTEPYFIVANDDVVFHHGWDEIALSMMEDPVRVVGIDQGNGRTDCFFLVDRRYVEEVGEFYHPGYVSQFVDTEFVDRAKQRGVWADADGALIEHRHWTLGKSEMDANYQRAVAVGDQDRALYEQRRALWAA